MAARELKVGGIVPFSTGDFPGKLSAVLFVQGCPWRCGYCHNPHLQPRPAHSQYRWQDIMDLLKRRVGLIDAVVFSGGEATMDAALGPAIDEVRQLGFQIGLHTACIYPRQLAAILPSLDWVGFDIKAPFDDYAGITGIADSGIQARACAEMIIASGVAYECRTTLHPSLLPEPSLLALANQLLQLGVSNYVFQEFRPQGCQDAQLNQANTHGYPSSALLEQITPLFPNFSYRRSD